MHDIRRVVEILCLAWLVVGATAPGWAAEVEVFPLEETAVFEPVAADGADERQAMLDRYQMTDHRTAHCQPTPQAGVVYPKLQSPRPLYGAVPLSESADPTPFVLDESEPVAEPAPQDAAPAQAPPVMVPMTPGTVPAMVPGAASTVPDVKRNYDVLYIDLNGDRDLTNDPPLRVMKDPPPLLASITGNRSLVVFDPLEFKPTGAQASEAQPVRYVPWLITYQQPLAPGLLRAITQRASLMVTPTTVRTGRIRIAETWYRAALWRPRPGMSGRVLVKPETNLPNPSGRPPAWQQVPLGPYQAPSGFYDIAASPAGDQISVGPYTGPLGELHFDPGARQLDRFGAAGTLQSSSTSHVWMGVPGNYSPTEWTAAFKLPEGDYRLTYFTLACGDLLASFSPNPNRPQLPTTDPSGQTAAFPIAIRAERPVVMRLGERPTVTFVNPSPQVNQTFQLGQPIVIQALLLDPSLDCIIRGLSSPSQKMQEQTDDAATGQARGQPVYTALVPRVSITNSAGREVARGPMPFG